MAMSRVEAAAYVVDHSISTSLTDPVRPLAASGAGRRVRPTDRPTASGALADAHRRLRPSRCWILCGHPLTGVGRFPNLAGGPAGPATRETLHCCRRA